MMNRFLQHICAAVLILGTLAGCKQFDELSGVQKIEAISATIKVRLGDLGDVPAPESYSVKMINYADKFQMTGQMGADGVIQMTGIIPGTYTITVVGSVSHNGFTYNFNGNEVSTTVVQDGCEFIILVDPFKSGNLVFKEIFYCGSRTKSGGAYFRDQFYEIYNNSETVQYADGLCIGNMLPARATANLPQWPGENADKYAYFESIWQIPGNGTEYPIRPGESIIIAQMADDHQRPELNPNSPVDLLSAEFETFVKTTSLVKDNPAVNMNVAFWPKPAGQWLVTVFGGAYAIFYPSGPIDPNDYVSPVGRKDKAYKVSVDNIVDAVELVDNESKMKLKRVPPFLDGGATMVGDTYCSKSVIRKIKETLPDGRVILMDTNDSSEDFEVASTAQIRRYGAKIPVWNTWAN